MFKERWLLCVGAQENYIYITLKDKQDVQLKMESQQIQKQLRKNPISMGVETSCNSKYSNARLLPK